jgi:hypothetical protein
MIPLPEKQPASNQNASLDPSATYPPPPFYPFVFSSCTRNGLSQDAIYPAMKRLQGPLAIHTYKYTPNLHQSSKITSDIAAPINASQAQNLVAVVAQRS